MAVCAMMYSFSLDRAADYENYNSSHSGLGSYMTGLASSSYHEERDKKNIKEPMKTNIIKLLVYICETPLFYYEDRDGRC